MNMDKDMDMDMDMDKDMSGWWFAKFVISRVIFVNFQIEDTGTRFHCVFWSRHGRSKVQRYFWDTLMSECEFTFKYRVIKLPDA